MNTQSRTRKSLHNSIVAMGFFIIQLLLQFVSRKVFLDHLGTEVLGLNTTLSNILQFLNLAELGIGAAVGFSLYKPLAENNRSHINEIVTLHGMLYRRIAMIIIAGAIVLMCFFPLIFKKMELPMWYAYGSFGVLLISALIGYFVNFRQIVLSSAQMDYKIQTATNPWMLLKLVAQILALSYFDHSYEWWLALEFAFSIIAAISLHRVTRRTFPFLRSSGHTYSELKVKYKVLLQKVRQLFVHRIGSFVMSQFSTIVIYAYISLSAVALYGNYMLVIVGINRLCNAVFNSMGAGVGNLVAEGNNERIRAVFNELLSVRFAVVSIIIYGLLTSVQPLICLWVGPEYLFGTLTVALIAANLFINLTRNTVDLYVNAYGLFGDIWAPVAEASLNIGLSVLLGWLFGLNGILAGVIISLVAVIGIWKPYYLFSRGMRLSVWVYWKEWFRNLLSVAVPAVAAYLLIRHTLTLDPAEGWFELIVYTIVNVTAYILFLIPSMLAFNTGMRLFAKRLRNKL
ncbi:MAG: sugar transporter [Muribaculaceae bacterium]|nr:sugar transporter [Muribaculaceae bacterium]MDE6197118.1 sugar transporter [Muribaculaceae bacterium]